jgi:hypothetical protein
MENMALANSKIKLNYPDRILNPISNIDNEIDVLKMYLDVDSKINKEYFDLQIEHEKLNLDELFSFIQDYLEI